MSSVYSSSKSSSSSSTSAEEKNSTWNHLLHAVCTTFYITHTKPIHRLAVFVLIVEFIQFYTFCFLDYFQSFEVVEQPIEYLNIFREWGSGFLPAALHRTIAFFGLFFLIGVAILGGWVFWLVESGAQSENQIKKSSKVTIFHVCCQIIKLLYLPLLHYFDDVIHCTETGGENVEKVARFHAECWNSAHVILSILFALASILLILEGFVISFFAIEWIPSKESQTSLVNARFSMLVWLAKTAAFVGSQYLCYLPSNFMKIIAFGILLICLNLILLGWMIMYLPFHQPHTNMITIVLLTVSSLAATVRTFAAFSSGHYAALIAFVLIQGVGAALAMFLAGKRIQRLYKLNSQATQDTEDPQNQSFGQEHEVEIAARKGYYNDDEDVREEAFGIFLRGLERFPHSVSIRLAHTIFMISQKEDVNMLAVGVQRIQKMNPPIDYLFLVFCLETHRKNAMYLKDGGFQEISESLRIAVKYQGTACVQYTLSHEIERAKKYIRAFWGQLIKEQNLNSLRDIVVHIEHAEQKAESVFQRLMRRFPKSAHLLRSYGQFCEEVKNDFEAAQTSFQLADELDEEKSKKHAKRNFPTKSIPSKWQDDTGKESPRVNNYLDERAESAASSAASDSECEPVFPISRNSSDTFTDSRLNQMGGAYQQNAEKIRTRRRNMVLQRVYRERIENTKSNALKKLGVATKVSIATLLLDILVIFIASVVVFNGWATRFEDITVVSQVREVFYSAALDSREAQLLAQNGDLDGITLAIGNLSQHADKAQMLHDQVNKAQGRNPITHEEWTNPSVPEFVFLENPPSTEEKTTSVDDLMLRMIQSLRILTAFDMDKFSNAEWNKDFRYIIENCPRGFTDAMGSVVAAFLKAQENAHLSFYTALKVCLPISVALLIFVTAFFFYPAQQKIKRERNTVLKLFVSIPKSILTGIYSSLSPEKDDDVPRDAEEEAYVDEFVATASVDAETQGMPVVRKLVLQYSAILFVCLSLVLGMSVLGTTMKELVDHLGPDYRYVRGEGFYARRMMFLAHEYVLDDENVWEGGRPQILAQFNDSLANFVFIHTSLRHNNEALTIHHIDQRIFQDYPCQFRDTNATCDGLEALFVEMLWNSYQLMNNAEEDLTLNNTYLLNILFLGPQIVSATEELCGTIRNQKEQRLTEYHKAIGLILAFTILALIISYFVLRSSENKIKKEDERTMKMLLMIPADVIESVSSIRDYLNGVSAGSQKAEDISGDIVARNKSIVDGSVDAVIVIDQQGVIQVWNPAAVKLFGFAVEEAIGKNVTMIIPDEIAKNHNTYIRNYIETRERKFIGKTRQLSGRHKDGHKIPLSISLSEGAIGEQLIFCGFLRDISDIIKWENELNDEKEKSQQLLFSFLPQYIATQLINDQNNGNRTLIAEAFKEVTVLFADIVGFTKLSSKVSPSELIHLLNTLFSKWDSLCEKHKVEKIKTIGDCYMAACGVPERCVDHAARMIEFAQDMLETLQELNAQTNSELQLRIGINTGSVVAGVIGTRKMAYDLWGDAVNVASRMESSGVPGRIQVSQTTFEFLKTDYLFEERGRTEIKGKGTMLTYLLKCRLFERTSSGHTVRRSAMTPVILKNLRSNTSGMKPEDVKIDISSEKDAGNENDIEMQGMPLSKFVTLEDEVEAMTKEQTPSPLKHNRLAQVMEKSVQKSASLPDTSVSAKGKKVVRKNISLPNAVEGFKEKSKVKFVRPVNE